MTDTRPMCQFGEKCYRKNPDHFKQFQHPPKADKKRARQSDDDEGTDDEPAPKVLNTQASKPSSTPVHSMPPTTASAVLLPKTPRAVWKPSDVALKWTMTGTLLLGNPSAVLPPSSHIASFDLDGTLTDTASGKTFAKGREDWRLFDACVPAKLRALHNEGFKIVIFSNQNGIAKGNTTAGDVKYKVEKLVNECKDVPFQVLMATAEDEFRKPGTGMWSYFLKHCNGGVGANMSESFYCGDAAGRGPFWKPGAKKDFACGDRKFANNVELPFHTPDEYFLGMAKAPFSWRSVVPADVLAAADLADTDNADFTAPGQELVIMVGQPASGKSSFVKRFLVPYGYVRVNQDTLKTEAKCRQAAEEGLNAGKSVVIDNTNASAEKRAVFLQLAKSRKIPARAFLMKTDGELCQHNNMHRELTQGIKHVPGVAYNMFRSKFQAPTSGEGFTEVVEVPFMPHFDTDDEKKLFCQLTEHK